MGEESRRDVQDELSALEADAHRDLGLLGLPGNRGLSHWRTPVDSLTI